MKILSFLVIFLLGSGAFAADDLNIIGHLDLIDSTGKVTYLISQNPPGVIQAHCSFLFANMSLLISYGSSTSLDFLNSAEGTMNFPSTPDCIAALKKLRAATPESPITVSVSGSTAVIASPKH